MGFNNSKQPSDQITVQNQQKDITKTSSDVTLTSWLMVLNNQWSTFPSNKYLHKVNNRNNTNRHEICSKLTIKTPKRRR